MLMNGVHLYIIDDLLKKTHPTKKKLFILNSIEEYQVIMLLICGSSCGCLWPFSVDGYVLYAVRSNSYLGSVIIVTKKAKITFYDLGAFVIMNK